MGRPSFSPGKKLTGGKFRPVTPGSMPQPACTLSFLCYDKRDWEKLGYLKFLKPFKRILETVSPVLSL